MAVVRGPRLLTPNGSLCDTLYLVVPYFIGEEPR